MKDAGVEGVLGFAGVGQIKISVKFGVQTLQKEPEMDRCSQIMIGSDCIG